MKKKPLIILTGPTAVGKTELSIGLAKAIGGEIISADSMQVYKKMDIGTAKISKEDMCGVKHHLIDILEPCESFSVADFKKYCKEAMNEIYSKGKIPIIVGGTGFYIQAVLYDIDFEETESHPYRKMLEKNLAEKGKEYMFDMLRSIDEKSAENIHMNNTKRVLRAIEYYRETGEKMSEHNEIQNRKESPYNFKYYVLSLDREILYERINKRVDIMKNEGLTDEVKKLLDDGCTRDMVSMQGLGYKEIIDAINGDISMESAYDKIKQETRHFAKRQFTWFKREKEVTWIDKSNFSNEEDLLNFVIDDCKDLTEKGK